MKWILLLLLAMPLWAESSSDSPASQAPNKQTALSAFLQHLAEVKQRREQRLEESKARIEKMRVTVEKMKTDAARIKDEAAKSVALNNISLWEMSLDSMQKNMDTNREMLQKRGEMMFHRQKQQRENQEKGEQPK